jgi:hypothetical protein
LRRRAVVASLPRVNLDRYEVAAVGRRRLSGRTERRGAQTGLPTWGAMLFGGAFVIAGILIILVGTKIIPVDAKGVHAPYWVLTVFGGVFALAGFMVWGMAAKQHAANRRRAEAQRRHPGEAALADYAWDPREFRAARWPRAAKAVGGAAFMTLFLSMFNWWAFFANGPWPVKAIVILFDLILIAVWWQAVVLLGRALKFGGSHVEFARFPYRLTEPLVLRWQPANGIAQANKGTFTLRCVEEWFERRGHGKNRSAHLVQEEVWSGTWFLEQPHAFQPAEQIEFHYEPRADAPPTRLSADRPVFWEFEVKLDLPGFDFEETYLVPVYESA